MVQSPIFQILHAVPQGGYGLDLQHRPGMGGFRATDGNYLLGTVIGQGVVPVKDCIDCLKEAGYDGYVSVEFEGKEDNISALQAAISYLREFV